MTVSIAVDWLATATHGLLHRVETITVQAGAPVASASSAKGLSNLTSERVRRVIVEHLDDHWKVGAVYAQHGVARPEERIWATVHLLTLDYQPKRRSQDYTRVATGVVDVVVSVDQEKGSPNDENELLRCADGVAQVLSYEHLPMKSYGLATLGITKYGMLTINELGLLEIDDYQHGVVRIQEPRIRPIAHVREMGRTPDGSRTFGPRPTMSVTISFDIRAEANA